MPPDVGCWTSKYKSKREPRREVQYEGEEEEGDDEEKASVKEQH
jgi:hypothetical protein